MTIPSAADFCHRRVSNLNLALSIALDREATRTLALTKAYLLMTLVFRHYLICLTVTLACATLVLGMPMELERNASGAFERRGCKWDDAGQNINCDEHMPTALEVVKQMHDPKQHGIVDATRSVVFYTNLADPNINGEDPVYAVSWMMIWLRGKGMEEKHYSVWNGLSGDCK